jgi:hypothetical protein
VFTLQELLKFTAHPTRSNVSLYTGQLVQFQFWCPSAVRARIGLYMTGVSLRGGDKHVQLGVDELASGD